MVGDHIAGIIHDSRLAVFRYIVYPFRWIQMFKDLGRNTTDHTIIWKVSPNLSLKSATTACRMKTGLTTAPAATVHPFPILQGPLIIAPPPIQQSSPISIGYALSYPPCLSSTSVECVAAKKPTRGPHKTLEPNLTGAASRIIRSKLA